MCIAHDFKYRSGLIFTKIRHYKKNIKLELNKSHIKKQMLLMNDKHPRKRI